jgi:hypothetical protein
MPILAAALMLSPHPCGAQTSNGCPVQIRHTSWKAASSPFSADKVTYKRCSAKSSNPIPLFGDLAAELAHWQDRDRNQKINAMAQIRAPRWRGSPAISSNVSEAARNKRL